MFCDCLHFNDIADLLFVISYPISVKKLYNNRGFGKKEKPKFNKCGISKIIWNNIFNDDINYN